MNWAWNKYKARKATSQSRQRSVEEETMLPPQPQVTASMKDQKPTRQGKPPLKPQFSQMIRNSGKGEGFLSKNWWLWLKTMVELIPSTTKPEISIGVHTTRSGCAIRLLTAKEST